MDTLEAIRAAAAAFGREPLLVSPDGRTVDLAEGYIPRLARFTFEDKAAKGLRKRKADDKPEPPVYFSALELVRDNKALLLTGPSGSGKTTFAKHLSFQLATEDLTKARPLVRNELGHVHDEKWEAGDLVPCYFSVESPESLQALADVHLPGLVNSLAATEGVASANISLLIIIDAVENAADRGPALLAEIVTVIQRRKNVRLLVLGGTSVVKSWALPAEVVRHDLLHLLEIQRRRAIGGLTGVAPIEVAAGVGPAAATPAYYALASEANHSGNREEDLLDAWLAIVAPESSTREAFLEGVFEQLANKLPGLNRPGNPLMVSSRAVQSLLAARYLADKPPETAISLFHDDPKASDPILRSLLARLETSGISLGLIEGLTHGSGANAQRGALLASDFIREPGALRERVSHQVLAIVENGALSASEREQAARVLSRWGDPRDLTALAEVPEGMLTMGSESHPNSQPVARVAVGAFRIGLYPVANREFAAFVRETGRDWVSPDGSDPERQNVPATDLTWHEATAYCEWLTNKWRASGRLEHDEGVRLPTEPEWERAARGDQGPTSDGGPAYPWGTSWRDNASNCDETGFNTTCAVGLFPLGRSPYGCYDMAGQVWEWCTTLWGEDMATPSFQYPWRPDDGREAPEASGTMRRVLRGGCFSSGRLKACCTYRGSLEPAGFWRGNGFRIVVSRK